MVHDERYRDLAPGETQAGATLRRRPLGCTEVAIAILLGIASLMRRERVKRRLGAVIRVCSPTGLVHLGNPAGVGVGSLC